MPAAEYSQKPPRLRSDSFRRIGPSGKSETRLLSAVAAGTVKYLRAVVNPTARRPKGETGLRTLRVVASILWLMLSSSGMPSTVADESGANREVTESERLFVRRIAPLFSEKCVACHGADTDAIEGSLDLTSAAAAFRGGDSGQAAVVPGDADSSPVYLAALRTSDEWSAMPPKESEALSSEQRSWLREWISTGAHWPSADRIRSIESTFADAWSAEDGITVRTSGGLSESWTNRRYPPESLWAYQPLPKASSGITAGAGRSDPSVPDDFIERNLPHGLRPAPRADRVTLIRRAAFDLTGLPPRPKDVDAFVNDPADDRTAFAAVVERLLHSPHYGERMAQHWLDVVRYADSSGFANDFERGNAWRYRDYVVRSFNNDKPYDQFVREQIAGDETAPSDPEMKIAVGFLRMGPWELTGMEVAKVARQRFLDDVTNSIGEVFLAHSLQCARCHDHKFDPVPTRDYYSIQAVFANTQLAEAETAFLDAENKAGFEEQEYLNQRRQEHNQTLSELDVVLMENAQVWFRENNKSPERWDQLVAELKAEGHGGNLFGAVRNRLQREGAAETDYPPKLVGFTPQQFGMERVARKGLQRLSWEFDRYRPVALTVYNGLTPQRASVTSPVRIPQNRMKRGRSEQVSILTGGDPFSAGEPVTPGALSVIADIAPFAIPTTPEGRRTALAEWITHPDNPLTFRVIVNRVWQWHFGTALAANPNNFGSTGKRPAHPELLDRLAADFRDSGGRLRDLHRRIMLSDTYARSSEHPNPDLLRELDPEGTSLAVFSPRRLSAEELRDSMLFVSGELNPTVGGIPCRPDINREAALQPRMVMGTFAAAWVPNPRPQQRNRRSLYVLKLRGLADPMLEVFNAPPPDFSCERRESSTVTPQAFTLFNGQQANNRALALAARAITETESDHAAVRRIFRLALGRFPSDAELRECIRHWEQTESILPETPQDRPLPPITVLREAVEENTGEKFSFREQLYANKDFVPDLQPSAVDRHTRALADVCLVILNSNEFAYVY